MYKYAKRLERIEITDCFSIKPFKEKNDFLLIVKGW